MHTNIQLKDALKLAIESYETGNSGKILSFEEPDKGLRVVLKNSGRSLSLAVRGTKNSDVGHFVSALTALDFQGAADHFEGILNWQANLNFRLAPLDTVFGGTAATTGQLAHLGFQRLAKRCWEEHVLPFVNTSSEYNGFQLEGVKDIYGCVGHSLLGVL